jgi:hypothetical protein
MKVGTASARKRLASLGESSRFRDLPKVDNLVLTCAWLKQVEELADNGDA